MSETPNNNHSQPKQYEIRLQGHIDAQWANWFEGFEITHTTDGETILTGAVIDEVALYGFLRNIRNLGIPLIALNRIKTNA